MVRDGVVISWSHRVEVPLHATHQSIHPFGACLLSFFWPLRVSSPIDLAGHHWALLQRGRNIQHAASYGSAWLSTALDSQQRSQKAVLLYSAHICAVNALEHHLWHVTNVFGVTATLVVVSLSGFALPRHHPNHNNQQYVGWRQASRQRTADTSVWYSDSSWG